MAKPQKHFTDIKDDFPSLQEVAIEDMGKENEFAELQVK